MGIELSVFFCFEMTCFDLGDSNVKSMFFIFLERYGSLCWILFRFFLFVVFNCLRFYRKGNKLLNFRSCFMMSIDDRMNNRK